jgi:AAA15 family ATPase/GTPase
MRLVSITVRNFRSLGASGNAHDVNGVPSGPTLSFDDTDIIFLTGQNNTGKSTFLSAYEYLVTPSQTADITDFYGFSPNDPIEIYATFAKEDGDDDDFEQNGLNKWVDASGYIRFLKSWSSRVRKEQNTLGNPSHNHIRLTVLAVSKLASKIGLLPQFAFQQCPRLRNYRSG